MLLKRMITAVIGISVATYIINFGQWLIVVALAMLAFLAWHELYGMLRHKQINISYGLGLLGIGCLLGCGWLGNPQEIVMVILGISMLILGKTVTSYSNFSMVDAGFTILGMIYVGLTFSHLLLLRFIDVSTAIVTPFGMLQTGAAYLWLPFIGTWASDTLAFFVGSHYGRHKLCPAVSPGKTIEGAVGGLVGSIIGVATAVTLFHMPLFHGIIIGILVGIIAPFGDLVESAMKRFAGVKDSGRLLPGHGGVLDRFDSILFAVPIVYYYIQAFVLG